MLSFAESILSYLRFRGQTYDQVFSCTDISAKKGGINESLSIYSFRLLETVVVRRRILHGLVVRKHISVVLQTSYKCLSSGGSARCLPSGGSAKCIPSGRSARCLPSCGQCSVGAASVQQEIDYWLITKYSMEQSEEADEKAAYLISQVDVLLPVLMSVCRYNRPVIAQALIKKGADVALRDKESGWCALHVVALCNYLE